MKEVLAPVPDVSVTSPKSHRSKDSTYRPVVSIVMPVYNEQRYIERSLKSVLTQDYPRNRIEVIVADGMSTDRTRPLIRQLQARHSNLHLIDNPDQIVSAGLNAATAQAQGEIIIRVDGHCVIDGNYVRRCVEHLQTDGVLGVGGPIDTVGETSIARAIAVAMSSRFGVGGSAFRTLKGKTLLVDTVPFPAYTRAAICHAGPYDEEFVRGQDEEYNYRLRKLGGKLLLAADVRSRYYSRSSLWGLGRQYWQYGYWKIRVIQKHPWQMRPRQFVPACFVLGLLLSVLIVPFFSVGWTLLGGVVGSYLLANLLASVIASRGHHWTTLVLTPVIFLVLHTSYGLGNLVGLLAFWNRWTFKSLWPVTQG